MNLVNITYRSLLSTCHGIQSNTQTTHERKTLDNPRMPLAIFKCQDKQVIYVLYCLFYFEAVETRV